MTKKILYIDLDNTLVDFRSGIDRLPDWMEEEFGANAKPQPHYDDAPGIFALMEPMPGAANALETLSQSFDTYLLSTAPWDNPSAWSDKLLWVKRHLRGADPDSAIYKRLILSHHKNMNRGDYLVDDSPKNGAQDFEGTWIEFGSPAFPNWPSTVDYLLAHA